MDTESINSRLLREWELDTGFLGRLREGVFDAKGYQRLLRILESIKIGEDEMLDRRFVSLTWFIPTFMEWQRERVVERGGNERELDRAINKVVELLYRILGVP